jgi:hypothetical protein
MVSVHSDKNKCFAQFLLSSNKKGNMMEKLQKFMLKHPYISMAVVLPFAMVFVLGVFSILINIILPAVIAFWLAGWIYTAIVGKPVRQYYRQPFWYTNYK